MHIIIGLLIALGGAVWAINHLMEGAREARNTARRMKWDHNAGKSPMEGLSDPREAAAILFVQMRRYAGELTQADKAIVADNLITHMGMSDPDAEEMVAFAAYATSQSNDAANQLSKLLKPIQENCTIQEQQDFVDMLTGLKEPVDSDATAMQETLINRVKDRLLR